MKKQMTVGKRLTLGFAVVLLLTVMVGAVSIVGISKLRAARDVLTARTAEAAVAAKVPFWTIKQYQNQADLIINRDLKLIENFDSSAEQMDKFRDELAEMVDTPEEKAWFAQLVEADQEFDRTFREKVVPEIQHQLQNFVGQYDAEADTLIGACEEAANKLEASIRAELDEAAAASNDELLKKRIEQLLAVKNLNFWMIKQYQNQADLIINRNLDSAKDFAESAAMMDRYKEEVAKAVDTDEEKALLAQINQLDNQFDAVFNNKVLPEVKRILENRIGQYDGESDTYMTLIEEMATKIADSLTAEAQEASASFDRIQAIVRTFVITFSIVCVVLGSMIALALIRSLVKSLTQIIRSLSQGSEQVAAASGQVSSASQSLAEGATEQAAGLEETSSSLEEMASMTRQNADNAQQANALATEAHKAADTGAESMSRMNQAIQQIQKSSDETAKIIKVIDEIAFQTNLLALNAAVEAARAGEAGKGFAVVAEEVRNLAMRSADAAKNTSNMIEESVKNARNGVDIAGQVGKALEEIVQSVGKTTTLISEIAAASQEQAQGIDQVNTAVSQMDKVTQQNAANAEESASASEELSSQAEAMNAIVGDLTALVGGAASAPPSQRSPGHTRQSEAKQPKEHGFHRSDAAWHRIADASSARQAIPLGPDDDELGGFNN